MKLFNEFLLVAAGGSIGAIIRYAIARACETSLKITFPVATLTANVIGCFLIGLLIGSGIGEKSDSVRLWFGVGLLGSLTTFSTFGAETIKCLHDNQWSIALSNVFANLVLGLLAVALGILVMRKFTG